MKYYRVITPGTTFYVESNLSEIQVKRLVQALAPSVENISQTTMLKGQVARYTFKINS